MPIRKKGKLPYKKISKTYELEYGVDSIEIHIDAFEKDSRVLLIDDLIATGGTAQASIDLIEEANACCVDSCFIINLSFLKGMDTLPSKTYSVFPY